MIMSYVASFVVLVLIPRESASAWISGFYLPRNYFRTVTDLVQLIFESTWKSRFLKNTCLRVWGFYCGEQTCKSRFLKNMCLADTSVRVKSGEWHFFKWIHFLTLTEKLFWIVWNDAGYYLHLTILPKNPPRQGTDSLWICQWNSNYLLCSIAAWAADNRAIGTRNGEQET